MGMFDDLIPKKEQPSSVGMFDDLIPEQAASTPTTDEPTPEELEAASKPAMLSKRQIIGRAPALEAARAERQAAEPPSLVDATPRIKRDFTAVDEEIKAADVDTRPMLLPGHSKKTRQMGVPALAIPDFRGPLTPEKVAELPNTVQLMSDYLQVRQPNKAHPKDPKGIVDSFRSSFVRGDIALADELVWSMNASPEHKEIAAKAYELSDKLGTPILEEMRAVLNPIESPTTLLSSGVGLAVKQAAVMGIKTALKASTQIAAVEGGLGAAQSLTTQKISSELGITEELSYAEAALSAGISATVGKLSGIPLDRAKTGIFEPTSKRMEKLVAEKGKSLDQISESDKQWLAQYSAREKEIVKNIREDTPALFESTDVKREIREGTLDQISAQTDTTKAVLNDQTIADIYKVTRELFKAVPELRPNLKETKITQGIVDALSKAGPDDIQAAAARAGVSPADFLETFKVSLSDAGQVLQQASQMSKFVQNLSMADPELEKVVNRLYKQSNGIQYFSDKVMQPVAKATGLSVAALVLAPSTSIVNAMSAAFMVALNSAGDALDALVVKPLVKGLGAPSKKLAKKEQGLTAEQATDLLDEVVINVGRTTNDAGGFVIPLVRDRTATNMADIVGDSFFLMGRMADAGWTHEIANQVLKDYPRLNNMMVHIGAESDERGVSKLMTKLQALNIAVDAMVRKPTMVNSMAKRMDDIGLDYEEFIANKRPIPRVIAEKAADDAMKATFTYSFKSKQQLGEQGFEASMEHAAFFIQDAIKTNVYLKAGADLAFPFSRFIMNSIRHAYRMTPVSGIGGLQEISAVVKLRKAGKLIEADALSYDARRKVIDSTIGTAAIIGIMATRDGTVQTAQYRDQDGNIRDGSTLSPLVQLMVLADVALLAKDMLKDFWYTIKMTPEERFAEGNKFQEEALKLDKNDPKRQDLLNQYELMSLQRFRNINGTKTMEVLSGLGRRSATQDTYISRLSNALEDGLLTGPTLKDIAYEAGSAVGRYDALFNPLYEAVNAARDDMRVVESKGSTKMEPVIGETAQAFLAPIASGIPGFKEQYSDKPRLLDTGKESDKLPLITRQLLGVRPVLPTTATENEVNRLGIELFRVYRSSGDRDFDALHIRASQNMVDMYLTQEFKRPDYEKDSMNGQIERTKDAIAKALENTKKIAEAQYQGKSSDKAVDMAYDKIPRETKAAAIDRFVQRNEGRKPSTTNDKRIIMLGGYKFNKGGVVQQMDDMLVSRR